jgi:hypothetical protein
MIRALVAIAAALLVAFIALPLAALYAHLAPAAFARTIAGARCA